jgi:endogenous inhibitor of DNA gyrase (YacG/DUF329 family)
MFSFIFCGVYYHEKLVFMMSKCPQCSKKAISEFKPFCSKRCADADLAAWITEKYRVATNDETKDSWGNLGEDDDENLH